DRPMRADLGVAPVADAPGSPQPGQVGGASGRSSPAKPFRLMFTGDFRSAEGTVSYRDVGLDSLVDTGVEVDFFARHLPAIAPYKSEGAKGGIVLPPRVTAASLAAPNELVAVGRFGVGYDSVDVPACTAADVLLYIAAGAVDRSVAEATVGWMLALSHHVRVKDRLVREARWDERSRDMGAELRDRTLGVIGFGSIGRELVRLLAGFGMNPPLVYDPFVPAADVIAAGASPVMVDELLARADFVSIHCPLTDQTRNLIGARELARMKPSAYLINT